MNFFTLLNIAFMTVALMHGNYGWAALSAVLAFFCWDGRPQYRGH